MQEKATSRLSCKGFFMYKDMIAIIAEKPSVGKDIARVLGANESKKGYMEGGGYIVTWAFGHLVTLALPEDYRKEKYRSEELPVLPDPFLLKIRKTKTKNGYGTDPVAQNQLKTIGEVFKKCDRIIVACDAGREGELIFRFIYHYLKCDKPFSRLWISSLTDAAIREGLANLKDGKQYDSLYLAAEARSKADWMVGINASRALGFCLGDNNNSLGRVQTPTLAMICKRYNEHINFKPEPYWELFINTGTSDESFPVKAVEPYSGKAEADKAFELLRSQKEAKVIKVENKQVTEQPPLLHDLASLQKAANIKYGYSAETTLSAAQRLYEKKCITYPRTGSRYIPDDVFDTVPSLLESLLTNPFYSTYASGLLSSGKLNDKSVDAAKVTDHHAILITGILPDDSLGKTDINIHMLIADRCLESFMPPCVKDTTVVDIDCAGILFRTKGYVIKEQGWRIFPGTQEDAGNKEQEENRKLPVLKEGDILEAGNCNLVQKKTTSKPLYTEASLLTAMETCAKELEDDTSRRAIKDTGIGTPATRAAIIETLLSREYIERQKKKIVPTAKGMEIYKAVKGMRIADVEMTANWEQAIAKIEQTPDYYDSFLQGMKVYARQMTAEILSMDIQKTEKEESSFTCPKCKSGRFIFYPKVVKCNNRDCGHIIYRRKSEVTLTDKQLADLLNRGRTALIKGFKSKLGQPFDACLVLDGDCNLKFDFSANNKNDGKAKK